MKYFDISFSTKKCGCYVKKKTSQHKVHSLLI